MDEIEEDSDCIQKLFNARYLMHFFISFHDQYMSLDFYQSKTFFLKSFQFLSFNHWSMMLFLLHDYIDIKNSKKKKKKNRIVKNQHNDENKFKNKGSRIDEHCIKLSLVINFPRNTVHG